MTAPGRTGKVRQPKDTEGRMSLGAHFQELRRRLIIASLAILVGSIVGWFQFDWLFRSLTEPLRDLSRERQGSLVMVNFGGLTQPFSIRLKVAMTVGLIVSSPVWVYEIWAFLAPGLKRNERRHALAFVGASVPLFLAGCALAIWLIPRTVGFLYGLTPDNAANLPDAQVYISFVTQFIVGFGFAFLLPVLLTGLNMVGVLPGRVMLGAWRVAVVLISVFAAVITPDPSAWSMLVLAVPMVALYFIASGLAVWRDRRKRERAPEWSKLADDEASAI